MPAIIIGELTRHIWSIHYERRKLSMTPLTLTLSVCIALSALLTIAKHYPKGKFVEYPRGAYLFKPLTTLLLIALAFVLGEQVPFDVRAWLIAGLVLSLAGDVFLMLPRESLFIFGLGSFLLAHLCYIVMFVLLPHHRSVSALFIFIVYAAWLLGKLWPNLGELKIPVLIYSFVLMLMGVSALWHVNAQTRLPNLMQASLTLVGALLFIASDSLLALNRFRKPFASAQAWVLATYFLAQWCIIVGVLGFAIHA